MTIRVQIQCITKPGDHFNPHTRIEGVGGVHASQRWWMTEDDAIKSILNYTYDFFVRVNNREVKVIVAERNGRRYLKTEADTTTVDNLLYLPECPRS